MIGIKVNMPKNCQECPCLKFGEYGAFEKSSCAINHKIVISNKKRPFECPLVELKYVRLVENDSKLIFGEDIVERCELKGENK